MTHSIHEIEGIDPPSAALLVARGITNIHELLRRTGTPAQRNALARKLGVTRERLADWIGRADLLRLTGASAALVGMLEACGVRSCAELQHRVAANLYARLKLFNDSRRLLDPMPSLEQIEAWIIEAANLVAG